MNLHAIAGPYVAAVSPWIEASYGMSAGNQRQADYTAAPQWIWYPDRTIQVQPLSANDLKRVDGINQQKINHAVYMNGKIEGVDRLFGKGGDMLRFQGQTWLVTGVIENWDNDGWTKVVVTLQVNST